MKTLLAALAFFAVSAHAQTYTVVSASSGGDIGDTIMRAALSQIRYVSDYAPGGNGVIAPNRFVTRPPGSYLLMSGLMTQQVIAPIVRPAEVNYTDADFVPITTLASTFFVVLSAKKMNVDGYLSALNDGARTAVSGENAIFILKSISQKVARPAAAVNYRSITQGVIEMLGGDVAFSLVQAGTAHPFMVSGKAHAVAITNGARVPQMRDTPTLQEYFPGFVVLGSWGLYGQKHMSVADAAALSNRIADTLGGREAREVYERNFLYTPTRFGAAELVNYVATQRKNYLSLMAR